MSNGSLRSRLLSLLEPVAAADGFDIEDVVVTPAGNRRLVRVLADCDGGITLDDVATLSRTVAEALDTSDVMGTAAYVLEVSSPGVDHPLTLARHWRRAAGRLVKVSVAGSGQLTARVVGVRESGGDQAVLLTGPDGVEVSHPLSTLGPGAVQVEFSRPGTDAELDETDDLDDGLDDDVDDLDLTPEEVAR